MPGQLQDGADPDTTVQLDVRREDAGKGRGSCRTSTSRMRRCRPLPGSFQAGEQTIGGDLSRLKAWWTTWSPGGYVTGASSTQFEASYAQFSTGATKMIQGLTGMAQFGPCAA